MQGKSKVARPQHLRQRDQMPGGEKTNKSGLAHYGASPSPSPPPPPSAEPSKGAEGGITSHVSVSRCNKSEQKVTPCSSFTFKWSLRITNRIFPLTKIYR